jgi:hypothetical protein
VTTPVAILFEAAARPVAAPRRWRLSRATVAALVVVLVAVDMFLVTSLHGAVASIERTATPPLTRWARDSIVMLPFYVAAVWIALRVTHRTAGHRRESVRVATALALTVALTTLAGMGHATATAWYDYSRQVDHIAELHGEHMTDHGCDAACRARNDTIDAHRRGIVRASALMAGANTVLAAWVLALRGGHVACVAAGQTPTNSVCTPSRS